MVSQLLISFYTVNYLVTFIKVCLCFLPCPYFVTINLAFQRHFNWCISKTIHRVNRRICECVEWRESKLHYRKFLINGKSLVNQGKQEVGCEACRRCSLAQEKGLPSGLHSLAFDTSCFGEELFSVAYTISLGRVTFRGWTTYSGNDKAGKNSGEVLQVTVKEKEAHANHFANILQPEEEKAERGPYKCLQISEG